MTSRILVIEHGDDATLDLMAGPIGAGPHPVEIVQPYRGDALPGDLGGVRALVVLGGEMGANDDDVAPWLPATRQLMADAVRTRLPLLGVCLGAQLLAAATGGRAERGVPGLELGPVPVRALPEAAADPFFGHILNGLGGDIGDVLQYHRDAVTTLPPDAELLVTGDRYAHQGFRVGECAWGVQYHPEVSSAGFAAWLAFADAEAPDLAAQVRAGITARGSEPGRPRLAELHATALLAAATVVA